MEWTKKDSRFILIDEEKQGVMFASNAGANLAKGKFIARMDADDYCYPERLELQCAFLNENADYGAVSGLVDYISHRENTEGFARFVDWVNTVVSAHEIALKRFVESPIVNPTAMWRKDIGQKYGLYKEGDFPEDYEMWLRWLHNGVKIHKIDEKIVQWFDSDNRLTRKQDIYSDKAFYRIKAKYISMWLEKHNPFHPKIAVWGATNISRKRASFLEDYDLEIQFYIDIKADRQLDKNLVYYKNLQEAGSLFILVYMKHIEIRREIQYFLEGKGYVEGRNYLLVS